jgi:tRNA (mo5U34)-methyltransferase
MLSTNVQPTLSDDEIRARIAAVPFWFHQIEVAPGIVTPGIDRSAEKLQQLGLPEDMSGQRVLDIGAADGFFSFECERRGAEVIAIDGNAATGFGVARDLLGSRVTFINMDIYDLTPEAIGQFDLVLCLGVLYHLRHPLLGLERVHSICRGQLILETAACDHHFVDANGVGRELASFSPDLLSIPLAQFYPGAELNGDTTNWWAPNAVGLQGMLRSAGFEPYRTISYDARACVYCIRLDTPSPEEWANTASVGNPLVQQSSAALPVADGATPAPALDAPLRAPQPAEAALSEQFLRALREQNEQTAQLQLLLAQRDARIADLEARAGWLEGQSREARRALAAAENGRVLRILRWLTRSR